ncbi:MAG: Putrescine importer PuuP [Syntrophorhabdaceae bacterium PtaU1.Bin034]|nr:MAG: Putrescine importer PuuP [Syntrophorhabdaceae bacterium PtaU1.Bin034]
MLGHAFGVALNAQAAASRILFSMGRDRLIPGLFGKVHPKYKTPYAASIMFGTVTFLIALMIKIESLATLVNFGAMSSFLLLNFATFWYFFIKKGKRAGGDFFGYFVLPLVGFAIIAYVWYGFDPATKIVGSIWAVLGIIYGAIKSKGYREVPEALMRLEI